MIDYKSVLLKYYSKGSVLYEILYRHSEVVAGAAVLIARRNRHLNADEDFLYEAAMLHDIGIVMTDAPEIHCFGAYPYIAHGYLGREIIEREGFLRHALVAERHTGTGLTRDDVKNQNLPIPLRDYMPLSIEEKIICYADKFYSKSAENLAQPKVITKIEKSISKYGSHKLAEFRQMADTFGYDYLYHEVKEN